MRISKHLYQVCGRMYGSKHNVFCIEHNDSLILIDCGFGDRDLEIIQNNLIRWNLINKPIIAVLLTNERIQASGNAAFFQHLGAQIYSSFAALEKMHGVAINSIYMKENNINGLEFVVESAKGVTNGSVFIFVNVDNREVCFTGNTLILDELCHKVIKPNDSDPSFSWEKLTKTMEHFSTYKSDMILPGTGEICVKNATALFSGAFLMCRLNWSDYNKENEHAAD